MPLFFLFSFLHFLDTKNDVKALSVCNCSDIRKKVPQRTLAFCARLEPLSLELYFWSYAAFAFSPGQDATPQGPLMVTASTTQKGQLHCGLWTSARGQGNSGGPAKPPLTKDLGDKKDVDCSKATERSNQQSLWEENSWYLQVTLK